MSQGSGRIEVAVAAVFEKSPERSFTTNELAALVYRTKRVEKKHRVAMLRATQHVCPRLGWDAYHIAAPGHMLLFVNHLGEQSYLRGRTRAHRPHWSAEEIAENISNPNAHWAERYREWRRDYEIVVLEKVRHPLARELRRKLEQERRQKLAELLGRLRHGRNK